jgi:glycosyltransferase involved in cell wall biosynthesis
VHRRPLPARLAQAVWARSDLLPLELVAGRCEVFHGTNFILPPARRAAGVVTIHDLAFLTLPETVSGASHRLRALVPRSIRRAGLVLTPSEAVRLQVIEAYAVPEDRVRATPLGVDVTWFQAVPPTRDLRTRLGLPDDYVVFVGTLEPRKNLATLLAAHAAARAVDPGRTPALVLVGASGWGPDLDLHPGVLATGFLDEAALRSVVAGATALALPSLAEGFGLPVLEGLAAGTMVLASDIPVLREVGGPWARYAPPDDPDAWSELLLSLATHKPDPGGPAYAQSWTWERTAIQTLAAYGDVVT